MVALTSGVLLVTLSQPFLGDYATKGREDPPAPDRTCHEGDNAAGVVTSCAAEKVLSVLDVKPPPSQPRRWITELALGAYIVASGAAAMRREA